MFQLFTFSYILVFNLDIQTIYPALLGNYSNCLLYI